MPPFSSQLASIMASSKTAWEVGMGSGGWIEEVNISENSGFSPQNQPF